MSDEAPAAEPSRWLTMAEAAEWLAISRTNAYRLARTGRFPVRVVQVGSRLRVSRKLLEELATEEEKAG